VPSIITVVGYIASAVFLAIALKQLPLGTAYAMWTGMGIAGTTLLGIVVFHERLSIPQIICVIMIVVGVVGLKLLAKE
jgi:quaternary ammonium compound-resistance protein SugE